jgi:hypothetical protein
VLGGDFSRAVGDNADPRLKRSGYAGMFSAPPEEGTLDLEDFDSLVFRCSATTSQLSTSGMRA